MCSDCVMLPAHYLLMKERLMTHGFAKGMLTRPQAHSLLAGISEHIIDAVYYHLVRCSLVNAPEGSLALAAQQLQQQQLLQQQQQQQAAMSPQMQMRAELQKREHSMRQLEQLQAQVGVWGGCFFCLDRIFRTNHQL